MLQPSPLATCMPRWRQALMKARTTPSLSRTTSSGVPAALRAMKLPASGSAAEGQNGMGDRRSRAISASKRARLK